MNRIVLAASALVFSVALSAQAQKQRPAAPAAPAVPTAGTVIRVRMMQQGSRYLFDPANFTVRQGDIVEFVNVSGWPHNVQFEAAKIPAGAADVLNRAMANRLGPLQSPMFTQPNQTYRVSFAGAPAGTYDYFCLPHRAMNMKGVITVTAARR
jgi:plastocyanin